MCRRNKCLICLPVKFGSAFLSTAQSLLSIAYLLLLINRDDIQLYQWVVLGGLLCFTVFSTLLSFIGILAKVPGLMIPIISTTLLSVFYFLVSLILTVNYMINYDVLNSEGKIVYPDGALLRFFYDIPAIPLYLWAWWVHIDCMATMKKTKSKPPANPQPVQSQSPPPQPATVQYQQSHNQPQHPPVQYQPQPIVAPYNYNQSYYQQQPISYIRDVPMVYPQQQQQYMPQAGQVQRQGQVASQGQVTGQMPRASANPATGYNYYR